MENESQTESPTLKALYVHFELDGNIFIMQPDRTIMGWSFDQERLFEEMRRLKDCSGVVYFSVGVVQEGDDTTLLDKNIELMQSFGVECRGTSEIHPAVYDYTDSYIPKLIEAIDIAEMDVSGLAGRVYDAELAIGECQPGTILHKEWLEHKQIYSEKLKRAQMIVQRLRDLEFELRPISKESES